MFETIRVRPDEPLDDAYERVLYEIGRTGLPTYAPDLINRNLRSRDFGRILNVFEPGVNHVVYVCTGEWTADATLAALNDLLVVRLADIASLGGRPVFTFISACPVPDVMRYVFSDTPQGLFEALCMRDLALANPLSPEQARHAGEKTAAAVQQAFHVALQWGDLNEARRIDELVLDHMRPTPDRAAKIPEGAFQPQYGLIGLGCLLGEMLRRHPPLDAAWLATPESLLGVALGVRLKGRAEGVVADPIFRVMKLYSSGASESALQFTRTLLAILYRS